MNADMNPDVFRILLGIQKEIHQSHGLKTDVHYEEGKGALIVQMGAPLVPQYVLLAVSEQEIVMRSHFA